MTRLGVAGLGGLGEALIRDIPRVPSLELVAVQDVQPDRAREIAGRYGGAWSGERYEDLLAQREVDAVAICTPNALHAAQAEAALRAGKDVLVQKPLAVSHADAQRVIDVAAETGRLLFVDYTYRLLETMRAFQEMLRRVGRPRSARGAFTTSTAQARKRNGSSIRRPRAVEC